MRAFSLIRLGNPILRTKSKRVSLREIHTKRFQKFLDRLVTTCLKNDGVGIAAPQVGVSKRVIVVTIDVKNPRYEGKKPFPTTIVVNPKVTHRSVDKKEDWEGDLSADLRGLVPRSTSCTVEGFDRDGKGVTFNLADDFHARVFQHEIDHLDGVLFLDKVKRKKSFSEYKQWQRYFKGKPTESI